MNRIKYFIKNILKYNKINFIKNKKKFNEYKYKNQHTNYLLNNKRKFSSFHPFLTNGFGGGGGGGNEILYVSAILIGLYIHFKK